LSSKNPTKRIWKVSPGPRAKYWEDFQDQGIIALGWLWELGDLKKIKDYEKIKELALEAELSYSAIRQTWDLYDNVGKGHLVVAFGKKSIYDIGIVTSCYYFDDSEESYFRDGETYFHRRKVDWFNIFEQRFGLDDEELLYQALRWPQDSIHEITSSECNKIIIDQILKGGIIPSDAQIYNAIIKMRKNGKTIFKVDLLEEIFERIHGEGLTLRRNWQDITWSRIIELAEERILR